MTREEAIEALKANYPSKCFEQLREAVDMAIKALEQEPTYYPPCIDCNKKMDEIRRAYDKLKEQEPKTGQWIPVSEGLPEEREWYLVVFKEKDTGFQFIPRVADHIGENNWRIIDEDGLVKEYRDILECVAWMPLPEPYRGESEE